mmetsp:Transcript_63447/g.112811  ORF Transcript_63447/g.112811 Transcript_63447/m.112811 type:complete len:202 (-) Transcript_63447:529-1134(-)
MLDSTCDPGLCSGSREKRIAAGTEVPLSGSPCNVCGRGTGDDAIQECISGCPAAFRTACTGRFQSDACDRMQLQNCQCKCQDKASRSSARQRTGFARLFPRAPGESSYVYGASVQHPDLHHAGRLRRGAHCQQAEVPSTRRYRWDEDEKCHLPHRRLPLGHASHWCRLGDQYACLLCFMVGLLSHRASCPHRGRSQHGHPA